MTSIINRRFTEFNHSIEKHGSVTKYFGIPGDIDINYSKVGTKMQLDIRFFKKGEPFNFNLPIEMVQLITAYSNHFIDISLDIVFPRDYPFRPPVWRLKEVKHNIKIGSLDVDEYYENIVKNHNRQHKRSWSPATCIEKDILYFIQRVNHFEYLLEN
jgi:ubiquitin-protein ligase